MKKTGFTLIELLLVIAVIVIVAATALPNFSKGASEALEESRKSAFLAAYENTVTAANAMMSAATACGGDNWYDGWNMDVHPIENEGGSVADGTLRTLYWFAPFSTRQFKNNKGVLFTLSATVGPNHKITIVCKDRLFGDKYAKEGRPQKDGCPIVVNKELSATLEAFWNKIKDLDENVIDTGSFKNSEWAKIPIKWS